MRVYRYFCKNCSYVFTVRDGSTQCQNCGSSKVDDITTHGGAGNPDAARRSIAMQVLDTLEWGNKKHGNEFASTHEAIAVLREEYLELEQEVFHGTDRRRIREEALQVAAVAIKLIMHVDGGAQ